MELSSSNTFCRNFITFLESTLYLEHLENQKQEPHSLSTSEIIESKKTLLLKKVLFLETLRHSKC